jgi:hypothetical protein
MSDKENETLDGWTRVGAKFFGIVGFGVGRFAVKAPQ